MKFLVDINLSPQLCLWLRSLGHEASHLADLSLLTAPDSEVWDRGRDPGVVILSKDSDFYDRALLLGPPPHVLHIAVGNCTNERLMEILRDAWPEIENAFLAGSRLVSLSHDKVEIFP